MNDIFKMAQQAYHALSIAESELKRLYKENAELKNSLTKAVEEEREACASICDGISDYYETRTDLNQTQKQVGRLAAEVCGVRIRERERND